MISEKIIATNVSNNRNVETLSLTGKVFTNKLNKFTLKVILIRALLNVLVHNPKINDLNTNKSIH